MASSPWARCCCCCFYAALPAIIAASGTTGCPGLTAGRISPWQRCIIATFSQRWSKRGNIEAGATGFPTLITTSFRPRSAPIEGRCLLRWLPLLERLQDVLATATESVWSSELVEKLTGQARRRSFSGEFMDALLEPLLTSAGDAGPQCDRSQNTLDEHDKLQESLEVRSFPETILGPVVADTVPM
jgi:hypothetical protein